MPELEFAKIDFSQLRRTGARTLELEFAKIDVSQLGCTGARIA